MTWDRGRSVGVRLAALGVACGCAAAAALAQDDAGGLSARLDFSQRLEWTDNLDFTEDGDAGGRARTDLGFVLSSETQTQRVRLGMGAALVFPQRDDADSALRNPFVDLLYGRESASAALELRLGFRRSDVGDFDFDIDGLPGGDVFSLDQGTRDDLSASLALSFGRDAPFGGDLTLSQTRRDYRDVVDPDLEDSRTSTIDGTLRFEVTPAVTARLIARQTREDFEISADRTSQAYGAGLSLRASPVLSVSADLTAERVERGAAVEEGLGFAISADRELANGTLGLSVDSTIAETGRRSSLRVNRAMELPRGTLAFSVGLTDSEATDLSPLYGIDWRQDLPRAVVSVSLSQSAGVDPDGVDTLTSNLGVSYRQELDAVSGLSASLQLRDVNALGAGGDDGRRLDLSLSYNRDLTEDWDVVGGYSYALSAEDGRDDVTSNTFFLGIERSFDWRP